MWVLFVEVKAFLGDSCANLIRTQEMEICFLRFLKSQKMVFMIENGRRDSSLHFFCREDNGFHDRIAFCWFLSTFTVLLMLDVEAFSVIFAVS